MDHEIVKKYNVDPDTCSFNTGVYVVDMSKWKKSDITRQLDNILIANYQSVSNYFYQSNKL